MNNLNRLDPCCTCDVRMAVPGSMVCIICDVEIFSPVIEEDRTAR